MGVNEPTGVWVLPGRGCPHRLKRGNCCGAAAGLRDLGGRALRNGGGLSGTVDRHGHEIGSRHKSQRTDASRQATQDPVALTLAPTLRRQEMDGFLRNSLHDTTREIL